MKYNAAAIGKGFLKIAAIVLPIAAEFVGSKVSDMKMEKAATEAAQKAVEKALKNHAKGS